MVTPQTCTADTNKLWGFLPQFVRINDQANGYQFLSWLDGICQQQQIIDDLCRDTPTALGWSIILDVGRCPTYALPWLGQLVGVRFSSLILGNDNAMRSAIIAKGGFGRGTVAAITAIASPYLGPTGYVNIIEQHPDPYSLTIQIFGAVGALSYADLAVQNPTYADVATAYPYYDDMNSSQAEAVIAAAIQAAIPAGLVANIVFE